MPLNLRVTNATGATVHLSWDDVDSRQGYKLYRNGSLIATLSENDHEFVDSELMPGTKYQYKVVSDSDSDLISESTASVPVSPSNFKATTVHPKRVDLQWEEVEGADGYVVTKDNLTYVEQTTLTRTDYSLTPGQTYVYQVVSFVDYSDEERLMSDPATLTVEVPLKVERK